MLADPRLIVALDVPTAAEARALVARIDDAVSFYKVGLELFATGEGMTLARELKAAGKQVFLDWKLHDIGTTVQRAAAVLAGAGCDLLTVHAEPQVMASAVLGRGRRRIVGENRGGGGGGAAETATPPDDPKTSSRA